jgi:hypothetical protein
MILLKYVAVCHLLFKFQAFIKILVIINFTGKNKMLSSAVATGRYSSLAVLISGPMFMGLKATGCCNALYTKFAISN